MSLRPILLMCLLSTVAIAQPPDPAKVVTFNRADSVHCKIAVAGGKPLLETTFNETTVAITLPQNWGNGEFSVFVSVTRIGPGEIQINPREISAIYPDPDHTHFVWFDKAHDLDTLASARAAGLGQPGGAVGGPSGAGQLGQSASNSLPPNHPEARVDSDPDAGTRSDEESRQLQLRTGAQAGSSLPQLDPDHPPNFLRRATLKQGSKAAGYVFLRKTKGAKVAVTSISALDEIDIPVGDVVFRF